ncbi:hypothetical protein CMI37_38505 [Candidatus Pacearchaeota archaeon]|nr:hypothetical protein [Candidatus Pacearchaeota archaeon]|tara:strand:+ start:170 stop:358 length:189 start_codon:yes stop_codon:yes gene_type:complete
MTGTIYHKSLPDNEAVRVYHDGETWRVDHITDIGEEIGVQFHPTMRKAMTAAKHVSLHGKLP